MAPARLLFAVLAVSSMCAVAAAACSKEASFVDDSPSGATGTATGSSSATTGAGGGGGSGMGDECATPAECMGEDSECAARTCTNGFCGMSFRPSGFAVAVQTSGDCKKNACDGNGAIAVQDDDTDLPIDGNDCTTDTCSAGAPGHGNTPMGSPCGLNAALTCDGMGTCTGCMMAPQCGQDTECLKYLCNNMNCILAPVPDGGGNPPGQTDQDCKRIVCNGNGGTKVISDNADTAPDGNLCTTDFCSNGVPSYSAIPPQDDFNPCTTDACDPATGSTTHGPVADGLSCGGCNVCQNGQCATTCTGCDVCNGSSCVNSCSACETCNGSQCVSNCPGCQACVNGSCQGGCAPCQACQGNQCVGGCGPCETCNGSQCVSNCGPCEACQGGQCVNQCGPCQACQGGQCVNTCLPCEACSGNTCVQNCGPCEACDGNGNCATTCTGPCEACINNACQFTCGGCAYCDAGSNTCQIEPCCGDPCCGDPCCLQAGQGINPCL